MQKLNYFCHFTLLNSLKKDSMHNDYEYNLMENNSVGIHQKLIYCGRNVKIFFVRNQRTFQPSYSIGFYCLLK